MKNKIDKIKIIWYCLFIGYQLIFIHIKKKNKIKKYATKGCFIVHDTVSIIELRWLYEILTIK